MINHSTRSPFRNPSTLETIAYLFGISCLGTLFFLGRDGADNDIIGLCLAIFYAVLIRAFIRPVSIVRNRESYFTIEVMFLLSYFAVFYWEYQAHLLGIANIKYNTYFYNTYAGFSNKAITLSTIGLLSFTLGFRKFARRLALPRDLQGDVKRGSPIPHLEIGLLVLLLGFIALYLSAGWQSAAVGRYNDATSGGAAADGVYNIILMLAVVAVANLVYSYHRRSLRPISFLIGAVVFSWSVLILVLGDRNSFFIIAAALGCGVLTYIVKGRRLFILAIVGGSLFLYNFIEVYRARPEASIYEIAQGIFSPSSASITRDSSLSISTIDVRAALAIIRDHEDFGYGKYQIIGFGGVIPFVRGAILGKTDDFTDTSQVLTRYVVGPNASWNIGTNLIADLYLDLGVFGVILGLFAIGAFGGRIEAIAHKRPGSQIVVTFYIITIAYYSEYARYSTAFPVTSLAWAAALIFGLQALFGRNARASRSTVPRGPTAGARRGRYPERRNG